MTMCLGVLDNLWTCLTTNMEFGQCYKVGSLMWKSTTKEEKNLRIGIPDWAFIDKATFTNLSTFGFNRVCFNEWLYLYLLSEIFVKDLVDLLRIVCKEDRVRSSSDTLVVEWYDYCKCKCWLYYEVKLEAKWCRTSMWLVKQTWSWVWWRISGLMKHLDWVG